MCYLLSPEVGNIPDRTVTLGTNTAFNCSAVGPSYILYRWNRTEIGANGALVEIGFYNVSRVSGEDTPTLIISNVGMRDEGSYTCFASINGSSVGDGTAALDTRGESTRGWQYRKCCDKYCTVSYQHMQVITLFTVELSPSRPHLP